MKLSYTKAQVIDILLAGGIGVIPTDTIYGLVARAADEATVKHFYELKNRDHKPGTVIAASVQQLIDLGVPKRYLSAISELWPNPLSIEIPLGEQLKYLHQNTGRQAFRVVADQEVAGILELTGPLVTSSANQPGEPSAVSIKEAEDYFGNSVDFYLDGGDLSGRSPSTLIRIIDDAIEVVREGSIKIDELNQIKR